MKSKEERERCIQLNIELQRIARRDKKGFFNQHCLIIEENYKRGKTGNLIRKIGNIKGETHPKMGTIKDKNGRDLVDAEEIKKRWKEYMGELYKNILMNQITMMMWLVTQSQTFWECEVKWALRYTAVNKASECDEIPTVMQIPKG